MKTKFITTYKRLEHLSLVMPSMSEAKVQKADNVFSNHTIYDQAYLLLALWSATRRVKTLTKTPTNKSWQFNKIIRTRLGMKNDSKIPGVELALTKLNPTWFNNQDNLSCTKLTLCLNAAEQCKSLVKTGYVEKSNILGCLYVCKQNKILFINSNQFVDQDRSVLYRTLKLSNKALSLHTIRAVYSNLFKLLKQAAIEK